LGYSEPGGDWRRCNWDVPLPAFLPDDEPNDPAAFITTVPNWSVGETIMLSEGEQRRILAIETSIAVVAHGFTGVPHCRAARGERIRSVARQTRWSHR
jgi:hypothetical protein